MRVDLANRADTSTGSLRAAVRAICASAAALLVPAVAVAQEAAKEPMEEVLVTGTRIEQTLPLELAEYGNRVQVIEAAQIEKLGITDTAQALQLMAPSLYIQQKAGPFDYVDVSLQGSRTNEILWLVDGVRINNRLYNGTTPLDTIPASVIERIEVLEGGQGLFYGTQSVAGVINIITKSFTRETDGQLTLGLDSNDGRHVSGYARGSAGPHEFVFYASSDDADGYQPIADEDYQPSSTDHDRSYDVRTYGVKYGVDLGERVRLSAGYQNTAADLDFANGTKVYFYQNQRDEDIANVKLDWAATDNLGLYIKGYYHTWDTNLYRLENVVGSPGDLVTVYDGTYWGYKDSGVNALAKFVPSKGGMEYYFGYDYQRYSGSDDVLLIADQTETVNAFTFQVRSGDQFSEKLKLAAGARYNAPNNGDAVTIWNVSAAYDLSSSLFLRTNIGTSFRLPDAEQLFGIDPCCAFGNPELSGEQSTNVNLSIGGSGTLGGQEFTWEVVGFAREVEDLIAEVEDEDGNLTYENSDEKTEVRGFLVTMNAALGAGFSADLSYTQNSAKFDGSNLQIDRVPEDIAKIGLNYRPESAPYGASLVLVHRGDVYQTLPAIGRVSLGQATTADLSAYLEFGKEGRNRLTARVQNIADEEYTSRAQRERIDGTSTSYMVNLLGVPRTYSLMYNYSF